MGVFTDTGYQKESLAEWKIKVEDLFKEQFGDDADLDPSGPFGQLVAIAAKLATDQDEISEEIYLARDPESATGVSLDRISAETGTLRNEAGFTFVQDALCFGDEGTVLAADENRTTLAPTLSPDPKLYFGLVNGIIITKGVARKAILTPDDPIVSDSFEITINSVVYPVVAGGSPTVDEILDAMVLALPSSVTGTKINGTLEIFASIDFSFDFNALWTLDFLASAGNFQSNISGVITVPANSLTEIVTPISGWDSVNNPSAGITGTEVEKDPSLRIRRRVRLITGKATDNSIRNAVDDVIDVTAVAVVSNRTLVVDSAGIPAKSFETVVTGGDDDAIAQAIFDNMPSGIEPYGLTDSGIAVDSADGASYTIDFSRPVPIYIWIRVSRVPNTEEIYPTDGDDQVKAAIISWAEETLTQGIDLIRQRISTPVYSIPGSGGLTIEIDDTATPGGTPTYAENDIIIINREIAEVVLSRITIVEI